jgi:hypothetical protein
MSIETFPAMAGVEPARGRKIYGLGRTSLLAEEGAREWYLARKVHVR